jgi:hypothetical protein
MDERWNGSQAQGWQWADGQVGRWAVGRWGNRLVNSNQPQPTPFLAVKHASRGTSGSCPSRELMVPTPSHLPTAHLPTAYLPPR